ncbi:Tetratricopeptide repeat protein [Gammaproteobacteria bacterium]
MTTWVTYQIVGYKANTMTEQTVAELFISYSSQDTPFVNGLCRRLEEAGITVRLGTQELVAGFFLQRTSRSAITTASCFMVVLNPSVGNSRKIRQEIALARRIARGRGMAFQPLVLCLSTNIGEVPWFSPDDSPQVLTMEDDPMALEVVLPELIAAVGRCLMPDGSLLAASGGITVRENGGPVEELLLTLYDPALILNDGRERLYAEATLDYLPAGYLSADQKRNSRRFRFIAPLEPIEATELCWYLEDYRRWPIGEFQRRAQALEAVLPRWGQALYRAALGSEGTRSAREAWRRSEGERRFSIWVDTTTPLSTNLTATKTAAAAPTRHRQNGLVAAVETSATTKSGSAATAAGAATMATALLALPWELIHDGHDYLFQGTCPVRRYYLHSREREERTPAAVEPPVRVLLVSPRPEDENTPYLDHRQNAQPLVQTLADLGGLAQLTLLTPPTLGELEKTLGKARHRRAPYTVVHIDGYGVYDRYHGRGALCFEDPAGMERLEGRSGKLIEADDLGAVLREHRVTLVFLTVGGGLHRKEDQEVPMEKRLGCAATDDATTATLAARLLRAGVNAVVAMGHRVPPPTTVRFLAAFYDALVRGERVGTAVAKGRQALRDDPYRMEVMGTTTGLALNDWFVPIFYQGSQDLRPFRRLSEVRLTALREERRVPILGDLPAPPTQGFHGRSRELLALERRFLIASYAVITGPEGMGKTTLAIETARWLVENGRFERAVFVSLEDHPHARAVLDCLGSQLLAGWKDGPTATDPQAQQRVERALAERPTLILLDNATVRLTTVPSGKLVGSEESCLAATSGLQAILDLCRALQRAALTTRLLFTSPEALPPPYTGHTHPLGPIDENDAIALVAGVLHAARLVPSPADPGRTRTELLNLVQTVDHHPRALVLIAPELARHGVRTTTSKLRTILAELHRIQPDAAPPSSTPLTTTHTPPPAKGNEVRDRIRIRPLYAALVLSLHRLPSESQDRVRIFAHFRGVASFDMIAAMLDLAPEETATFGEQLVGVGLARNVGDGCLVLEPALPAYLTAAIDEQVQATDWERWLKAMAGRLDTLYKEWFRNANLCLRLTRRELPNLLLLLDWAAVHRSAEEALGFVWRLETLLAPLHLPRALDRVTALRERLAPHFVGWGRAAFAAEAAAVERLLTAGWLPEALEQAQALLGRAEGAGDRAYPGAAYDVGMAHRLVSRVLEASGSVGPALAHLEVARRRFQTLAEGGSETAARMASVCCTERGDCLRALGQLVAAATAYQEALTADEARGAVRDAAVNRLQLADIWRLQGAYPEALSLYVEARESFMELRESPMVAVAWHQIGLIHQEIGDGEAAEAAYREVLAIWVRRGDLNGEALTLIELGDLYISLARREQAAACYRQAADRYATFGNTFHEGQARRHLADTLLDLGETSAARQEIERALVCQTAQGHTAEPWKTWALLADIERKQGHQEAAIQTQGEAVAAYLAYRREGGEALFPGGRLCDQVASVLAQGKGAMALLEKLQNATLESNLRDELHALLPRIQAIIAGSRDQALADDPTLHYSDTAELRLLLERTGKAVY